MIPAPDRPLIQLPAAVAIVIAVTAATLHFEPDHPWLLCIFMALAFVAIAIVGGRWAGMAGVASGAIALALALPGEGLAIPDPDYALGLFATIALGLLAVIFASRAKQRQAMLAAELQAASAARDHANALLREMSHRLANDLAMLTSSASLAARRSTDWETIAALDELTARIIGLSRVYRRLRVDVGASERVDLCAFLQDLCEDMRLTHFNMRPIALKAEMDACAVPLSQAVIVGLIVNELLTNIAKHSYPDDRPGTVHLCLRPHPFRAEAMQLSVSDDGVGFTPLPPDEFHMGQRLIAALASQLGGDIAIARREGQTIATLHFPLDQR
ncbi:MAG: histidine kinase dimerization/phosphoacceptor domain -containing protein [Sphingomonas bacterium]